MKNPLLYIALVLFIFLLSCKKVRQPLQWDSEWSAPIAYGSLTMKNLLGDSLLSSDLDSSLILKYEAELFRFDLRDITNIGDTTFLDTFAIPFFTPVTFSSGQQFINQPEEADFEIEGAELSSISIKEGTINYILKSSIEGEVIYTYQIPSAKDAQGVTFTKDVLMPAATPGSYSLKTGTFSLDGYTLDLTGASGNETNKILTNINCAVASTTPSVTVSLVDTLFAANTISDLKISSAEGYFGNHSISAVESNPLNLFTSLVSGGFDINEIDVNFIIENGIGADASIQTNMIAVSSGSTQYSLTHPIIGTNNNINRAYRSGAEVYPSFFTTNLNENNSNIISLLESLPDSISYDMDITINPLNNISGYSDFIVEEHPLRVLLDASMPLNAIVNNLTLVDTIEVNFADSNILNTLSLDLSIANGFPLNAKIDIAILDQNDMVTDHLLVPGDILSGMLNTQNKIDSPHLSNHFIDLTPRDIELLRSYGKLKLTILFDSPDGYTELPIYDYYKLDYSLKAKANVALETEF
ncbi:MAG: hypothetical protein ACI9N1_001410 [Flavobacteriales bacterium]